MELINPFQIALDFTVLTLEIPHLRRLLNPGQAWTLGHSARRIIQTQFSGLPLSEIQNQPDWCGMHACSCSVGQSCLTLCDPMDCSPPGSSVHEIFQARRLEWVVISFPRDLPDPESEPTSLAPMGGFFTTEPKLAYYPANPL